MATDVGHGGSISFSSSFLAEITNIAHDGIAREAINTSHMGSTNWHNFIPEELADPGELTVELNFDQDATPPITATAESVTVTLPDGTATASWAASGFLTGFQWNAPDADKMTATATIKFSGAITVA